MFGFISRLFGRVFFYCFFLPLLVIAAITALVFVGRDIYNYQSTQNLLQAMEAADPTDTGSWATANGQIALITGQLTADRLSDRITDAAPQLAQCVALDVNVKERWSRKRGRSSSKELIDEIHVANDPRVAGIAIDPAFLQPKDLGLEGIRFGRNSALGFLCDGVNPNHTCEIKITCLNQQLVSAMGDMSGNTAWRVLAYPKQLGDEHLPLLQLGQQTPREFASTFKLRFNKLGPANLFFAGVGFFTVLVFCKTNRFKALSMLAVTAGLIWAPYALLDLAEVAYAPLVLFVFAALYLFRLTTSGLTPFAEGLARKPAPTSLPEMIYITPNYLASSTVPLAADSSYDDLVAPALAYIKARLSPLTLSALSPQQLEKTVTMHIETHACERWKTLTELQQDGLVAKVITALKKK